MENKILQELSEIKNSRINSESKYENIQNVSDQKLERESGKKLNFDFNLSPNRDNSINRSLNLNTILDKEYRDIKMNPYESNPNRKDDSRNLEDITLDNTNNDMNDNMIHSIYNKKNSLNSE